MQAGQQLYLTADITPIPCRLRVKLEDFRVEELESEPDAAHQSASAVRKRAHTWVWIEKRGISTDEATRRLSRALRIPSARIAFAGRKDAAGITTQWLSMPGLDPQKLEQLELLDLRILRWKQESRALHLGQSAGNRFQILLREFPEQRLADLEKILQRVQQRGLPNGFGPQRFGNRGDTAQIGRAMLRGEFQAAADLVAGKASELDQGPVLDARRAYDNGDYQRAATLFPRGYATSAKLCHSLAKNPTDPRAAFNQLDRRERRFYISAFQSWHFNCVLAERLEHFDQLQTGDLVWDHSRNELCEEHWPFDYATSARAEPSQAFAARSPSGPLHAPRMRRPLGTVAALEQRLLVECLDLPEPESLDARAYHGLAGTRRPLRIPCRQLVSKWLGNGRVELRFDLPAGAFATTLLGEIVKRPLDQVSGTAAQNAPHEQRDGSSAGS